MSDGAAERVEGIIADVVLAAVRDAGAAGVVLLDDRSPEGELVWGWLRRVLPERVHRASVLASNMQELRPEEAQWLVGLRAARDGMLLAHPVNRTALLLGGAPPRADILPLGDVWGSQVAAIAGVWSASADVEALAADAGGAGVLDAALGRWMRRARDGAPPDGLPPDVAHRMMQLYERGRFHRLRPRLVPKLGAHTLGIDLWD